MVISDTGEGIEPEALSRIFLPFEQGEQTVTRRFGGLGLGLNIARSLIEMQGGTLVASSAGKNKGAKFTVEMPLCQPCQPDSLPPAAPDSPSSPRSRILLVDDHPDTLHILSRLLKKWDYEVEVACSVQSALELGSRQKFDLLISDLGLPDGSGRDVMKALKSSYGLRGIALSGFDREEDVQSSLDAGFEEHFVKPVSFPALQATLKRLLSATEK